MGEINYLKESSREEYVQTSRRIRHVDLPVSAANLQDLAAKIE